MKTRGTRSGILLSLDANDTPESLTPLASQRELLAGKVFVEISERTPWATLKAVEALIDEAGGSLAEVRPPGAVVQAKGETEIIARTLRSGSRVESRGSAIVIGDVNAGAEVIAEDDIIVLGTLRGIAHAGAGGNESAFIWAQQVASKQLRIAGALAQAGGDSKTVSGPEVAELRNGQIILRPWDR
jgi:septum site-determining protein MinC